MSQYAKYLVSTGEILELDDIKPANVPAGQGIYSLAYKEYAQIGLHIVKDGKLVLKPQTPADIVDEASMLAAIDVTRNAMQMQYLTRGTSLSLEYASIQREYADYSSLLANVIATLTQLEQKKRWPTALTEMTLTGKTLPQVMATYKAAIDTNEKRNRVIGRIAVDAKARLRAATTLSAKRAVYRGINWAWDPGF